MKNRILFILFSILILASSAAGISADGQNNNQSYPIPQLYPIGQVPNQYYVPNQQQYDPQPLPQPYNNYQPQNNYYFPNRQPNRPNQPYQQPQNQQQYYYSPEYYNQQPFYDPNSGRYFYPINGDTGPNPFQPSYTYGNDRNVYVYKKWAPNGSVDLTWTIRNTTNEDWSRSNVDIKCISGCHLLTNQNQMLWDIPHTVQRNGQLSFTVNIWQPMYGETMTFAMIAGSKTLYTFNVNPN